jgi:hypothetical protein
MWERGYKLPSAFDIKWQRQTIPVKSMRCRGLSHHYDVVTTCETVSVSNLNPDGVLALHSCLCRKSMGPRDVTYIVNRAQNVHFTLESLADTLI